MNSMHLKAALLAGAAIFLSSPAGAQETIRIAFIDPLSGLAASTGEAGLKTFQYLAEQINAKGGVLGKKLEIIGYDNKVNAQESLVQLQKALDAGIRIITQGNGSNVAAALEDQVGKYNDRNPGKEVVYFNYAAVDPVLTNEKCSFWHFRWDANSDIKMEALTNYMKARTNIKKIYLINQDYSFGQAVRSAARKMISQKRPDVQIVGDEVHPLQKITDFSPYVAKIKASGADSVVTGNWANDFALLLKAAADAGLQVDWYTYYAGGTGGPTAIKQANVPDRVFQIAEGVANVPNQSSQDFEKAFRARMGSGVSLLYPRAVNEMNMLLKAIQEANSVEPGKIAAKLEGMKAALHNGGEGFMRPDDHQFFQTMYIANLGPLGKDQPFDEENTGWGWKVIGKVDTENTIVPTTCKMNRPS
jgi:branched-chain amino acid transport system substrate-binding protein